MEINKNNKIIKVSEGPELSELRLTYCWNIVKYHILKAKYGLEKVSLNRKFFTYVVTLDHSFRLKDVRTKTF